MASWRRLGGGCGHSGAGAGMVTALGGLRLEVSPHLGSGAVRLEEDGLLVPASGGEGDGGDKRVPWGTLELWGGNVGAPQGHWNPRVGTKGLRAQGTHTRAGEGTRYPRGDTGAAGQCPHTRRGPQGVPTPPLDPHSPMGVPTFQLTSGRGGPRCGAVWGPGRRRR